MRLKPLNLLLTFALIALACENSVKADDGAPDSTNGTMQEAEGGVSEAESKILGNRADAIIRKFKEGRQSNFMLEKKGGGGGRFTGILEQHDYDYDGLTDHDNPDNALEGGQDYAAIQSRGTSGPSRKQKLKEAKEKLDRDRNRAQRSRTGVAKEYQSPSAVLVDKGAAHGASANGQREEHRVYELTDESKKQAVKAGQDYADAIMKDAAVYDYGETESVKKGRSSDEVIVNGKVTKVAPDIDLLRSEAEWLEDQKARHVRNEWKLIRARRLAGLSDKSAEGSRVASVVAGAYQSGDEKKGDAVVAKEIAEARELGTTSFCFVNKTATPKPASGCAPGTEKTLSQLQELDSDEVSNLQQAQTQAKDKARQNQADFARRVQNTQRDIQRCMASGKWCKQNDGYKEATRDVGEAFQDTREFVLHQFDQAGRGPATKFNDTVTTLDFSENSDRNANAKVYQEYQAQYKKSMQQAKAFQQAERQKEQQYRGYQSEFLHGKNVYDPSKQSFRQLSRRDAQRDGRTLDNDQFYQGGRRNPQGALPGRLPAGGAQGLTAGQNLTP